MCTTGERQRAGGSWSSGSWPRGIKKDRLDYDDWLKEVAPSPELRKWFSHDPAKYEEFKRRYYKELDKKPEAWRPILEVASRGTAILLYSSRDTEHNNAVALKRYLDAKLRHAGKAA